jgi:fructokinase
MADYFGGMEGGGTKFVCAICDDSFHVADIIQIPTTSPEETLGRTLSFFKKYELKALGLSVFGPVDLDNSSPFYGSITTTPKVGWSGVNILSAFNSESYPKAFTLDVNAAILGEYVLIPQNSLLNSLVYITIGTGIGAGIIANGNLVSGLGHPEVGHMRIPHDKKTDPFPGLCVYHKDCLEGLASGPAIHSRWNTSPANLADDHRAWALESEYLAYAIVNIILMISPQKIILGGGVMNHKVLFPLIREKVMRLLNDYLSFSDINNKIDEYIVPPELGNNSGVMGALVMARNIYLHNR